MRQRPDHIGCQRLADLSGFPHIAKERAKTVSTASVDRGTYAFVFDQKGLMGGIDLQGSKITRINPGP